MTAKEFVGLARTFAVSWEDLKWGAKATLARSFGLHIVAMVFCGIGLAGGRVALLENSRASLRIRELEKNINKAYEPRRDERFPALNSALLGSLSTWSICDATRSDDPETVRQARRIMRVVDQSAEAFARGYLALRADRGLPDLERVLPQRSSRDDVPVPHECMTQRDAAGLNLHLRWPHASLFVPSYTAAWARLSDADRAVDCTTFDQALGTRTGPRGASGSPTLMARLAADAGAALAAMRPLEGLTVLATGGNSPQEVRLNSVYFISYAGYMITNPRENTRASSSFDWLGGDYVRRATLLVPEGSEGNTAARGTEVAPGCQSRMTAYGRLRHQSLTYLDVFGSGAVTTHCYPVTTTPGRDATQRLGGVFCVDLSVPRAAVHEHIFRQSVFDVGILRSRPEELRGSDLNRSFYCDSSACASGRRAAEASSGGAGAGSIPWEVARRVFAEYIRRQRWEGSQVTSVLLGETQYQVARVWRSHDSENERSTDWVVLVAPRDHRGWFLSGLAVALLCAGFAAAAVAFRQTLDSHGREWGPVRRLDAGFLVADEHDRLIRANDRCEEILGLCLPIVGTDPYDWSNLRSGKLGADAYFDTPPPGFGQSDSPLALLDEGGEELTLTPFPHLMTRRKQGLRDQYFVRVRREGQRGVGCRENWYCACANFALPFRLRGDEGYAPITFLTLTPVGAADWARIRSSYGVEGVGHGRK